MPIPTFTSGYPPDGSSLGNTKTTIRNNLDGTFQAFSIDHENQNSPDGFPPGIHKQSTYQALGSNPTTVAGQLALYAKAVTGGTALFSIRDGNAATATQITLPYVVAPSALTNGYTFLPGGILMQWGIVTSTSSSGTVVFPIAFPNFPFSITFGMIITSGSTTNHAGQVYVKAIPTLTNSQFGWRQADLSADAVGFFWQAVGN